MSDDNDTTDFAMGINSHCGAHYPADLPVECFREVVRIIRAGTIAEERAEFACHVWNVQGYAQRVVLGDPHDDKPPLIGATADETALTDQQAADALESATMMRADDTEAAAIPWVPILLWAAKFIFEHLRKK